MPAAAANMAYWHLVLDALPLASRMAAGRHAVTRLWVLLQDFCSVGTAPAAWRQEVPAGHPFMRWQPASRRWLLVRPSPDADDA